MTLYGNGYPAYNNGKTGVNLQYSTVPKDGPETDVVVKRSDIDGYRSSNVKGQRWAIEVQINLFKYADLGRSLTDQLQSDLGNENITLWRHVNGEPLSGTFTLTDIRPTYLTGGRNKDRVTVTFTSNNYVIQDGTNYRLEYINSIDLDAQVTGFKPNHVTISGRFIATTWQDSATGQTLLFNISEMTGLTAPAFIDKIDNTDVLSPTVTYPTNFPLDCLIEDRATPMLHISYWAKGLYGFYFDETQIIKSSNIFYDMDNANLPIWHNKDSTILLSQRTKVFSILDRNGSNYTVLKNAEGLGGAGTTVWIDQLKGNSLIATSISDATGKFYVHQWISETDTLNMDQSIITNNVREIVFDNRGYIWAQGRGTNSCYVYSHNADGTSVVFKNSLNPYASESWLSNIDDYIWLGDIDNKLMRQYIFDPLANEAVQLQQLATQYNPAGQAVDSGDIVAIPTFDSTATKYYIEFYKKVRI